MEKKDFFDRNILSLSRVNPELFSPLSIAANTKRYKFLESRSGEIIPALTDSSTLTHPLHSTIDPRKEAKRLIDSVESDCLLVLLGLGGAYHAEAALERDDIGMVVVIDYGLSGLKELLYNRDYSPLFSNSRFRLLMDYSTKEIEQKILDLYQPVLFGGVRVIPLRSRTGLEPGLFVKAGNAIEAAIEKVSSDYSVQAHFGQRWFSNTLRNIKPVEKTDESLLPIERAAICAAGPSLTPQIRQLRKKREELFLIAADTSLPCLFNEGICPDAIISIDCQHISYHHFMDGIPEEARLFLDLASPPLLSSLSKHCHFFTGGHPLTNYISKVWKTFPELDTSGGNVTHAALSLAEHLGAGEIELYGADFSYPRGISYARGAYIYSIFENRQSRFSPIEARASAFLFRTPLEKKTRAFNTQSENETLWYYETGTLNFYRQKLVEKSKTMEAELIPVEGFGAPINIARTVKSWIPDWQRGASGFRPEKSLMSAEEFLLHYRNQIAKLPEPGKNIADYLDFLQGEAKAVFTTILPAAAALKLRTPGINFRELFENVKAYCLKEIDIVLAK